MIDTEINDEFRFSRDYDSDLADIPYAIDTSSFALLITHAINERLAPDVKNRSWYDQLFLKTVASFSLKRRDLLDVSLAALLYADEIYVPNIDINPGDLFKSGTVKLANTGSYYEQGSEKCRQFLLTMKPYILNHPLIRHAQLTAEDIEVSIDAMLGFTNFPETDSAREKFVMTQVIIQELRSLIVFSKERQVPCFLNAFVDRPDVAVNKSDDLAVVELYFEKAIYSPRPMNIQDALDLRESPRIIEWRRKICDWTSGLQTGTLAKGEIINEIKSANDTLGRAKVAKDLVPKWSIYLTMPLGALSTVLGGPVGAAIGVPLLVVDGINLFGRVLWSGQAGNSWLASDHWYLLNEKT